MHNLYALHWTNRDYIHYQHRYNENDNFFWIGKKKQKKL